MHCTLCALFPGAIAAFGSTVLFSEATEWSLNAVAVVFAGIALAVGRRYHRSLVVVLGLAVGMTGLLLARYLEQVGAASASAAVGILSGLCLVVGHISNLRASSDCNKH